MGRRYFRLLFTLYAAALVVCGVLRIGLKLFYIDHSTGFYVRDNWMVLLFNTLLTLVLIALFLVNRLKRANNDYPVYHRGRLVNFMAFFSGLSMIVYSVFRAFDKGEATFPLSGFALFVTSAILILGFLGGLSLVLTGFAGSAADLGDPPALLLLMPPVWQIIVLLSRFNSYQALLPISDSLLAVLFMIAATLFLMGHGRNFNHLGRKDGRNYVISMGLATSLCGFLLTIPNFLYMLINRVGMPVSTLSVSESVYVFFLSAYALLFVIQFTKSIRDV